MFDGSEKPKGHSIAAAVRGKESIRSVFPGLTAAAALTTFRAPEPMSRFVCPLDTPSRYPHFPAGNEAILANFEKT